jgi:uncharacterized protein YcfL
MRRLRLLAITITAFVLCGCSTPEERAVAALEKELGLDAVPYFPKCLSEEVSPRAAVAARDYNVSHTVNNPQGNVPLDKCVRWETSEPVGKSKDKPQKLILTPQEKDDAGNEDLPEGKG